MRVGRHLVVLTAAVALLSGLPASAASAGTGEQTVTLYLAPHDRAALQELAHATGLSADQRRARLAALRPDAEDRRQVAAAAGRLGLTVTSAQGARVQVRAASGLVRQLFGSARGTAPASRFKHSLPLLPVSLRQRVTVAYGGDDARLSAAPLDWTAASTPPNPGLNGTDLRTAYSTTAPSANTTGATVATIQLSDWNPQNLSAYATAMGLTLGADQFQRVDVDGGPAGDAWADVEVSLDQEALLGTAPLAKQRAYFAPRSSTTTDPYLDAIYRVGDDAANPALGNRIVALSTSYGFCEDGTQADAFQAYEDALAYVLGAGVTVFAASGDSGAFCPSDTLLPNTATYPASSPSVVAVGGTSLASTSPVVETAWACGAASGCSSAQVSADCQQYGCAGGGTSVLFGRPTWQAKATSSTKRQLPDIAAVADPQTGFGLFVAPTNVADPTTGCSGGPCTGVVGGTSLAAPVSAALLADELMRAGRAGGVGDVHAALYASSSAAMRDIDDGGSNGASTAHAGYDLVTGLGVPQWDALAPALLRAPGDVAGVVTTGHAPYAWRSTGYTALGGAIVTPLSVFSRNGVDFFSGVGSNNLPYLRSTTRGWARLTASGACTDTQVALSGIVLLVGCRGTNGAAYVSGATLSDAGTATLDPWQKVGGTFVGAPTMTYVQGTLTLIGTGTNGYAYQSRYVNGAWSAFSRLPLTCASRPGLAVSGSVAVVACVGSDRTVHYLRRTSTTWPAQASAGGTAAGAAGVSLTADGRTTVFVTGTNRVLYSRTIAPTLSSWTSRGGSSWAFGAGATPTTYATPAARTQPATTITALSSSSNPSTTGATVTFTAQVTVNGTPVASGSVAFRDLSTSTTLGVVAVDGTGTAAFSTAALSTGTHQVVAIYSGTSGYASSGSPLVAQVVS